MDKAVEIFAKNRFIDKKPAVLADEGCEQHHVNAISRA
jgi:hypothetical protein